MDWRHRPLDERADQIRKIGKALTDRKEELAKLMTEEMGKLLSQSRQEVDLCAAICDWTAENASEALKGEERDLGDGAKGYISHEPIGVIYGIQP